MRPKAWVPLLALGAAALVLRLVVAAHSSVYVDEAFTYFISRADVAGMLMGSRDDLNPPAWYFVLHPLSAATHAALWLRLPSALCAAVAVPLAWLTGRRLTSPANATVAAGLLGCAYGCWLVDTQIRAYGITLLLVTACLWMLVVTLQDGAPPGGWIVYGVLSLCLPVFHYSGMLAALAFLGAGLLAPANVRPRLLATQAMALLPGLAWLMFLFSGPHSRFHEHHADWRAVLHAFTLPEYLTGIVLPMAWRSVPAAQTWSTPGWQAVGYLLNLGLWAAWMQGARVTARTHRGETAALVLLAVFPLLLLSFGANLGVQPYQNRYNVPMAAAFYLLLVTGLSSIRLSLVTWALVAVNVITWALYPGRPFLWNQNWVSPAGFISARQQAGDHVAAYIDYSLVGLDFYYGDSTMRFAHDGGMAIDCPAGLPQVMLTPDRLTPDLDRQLGRGRVFLVLNQEDAVGGEAVRRWFHDRYHVLEQFHQGSLHTWGDITVYLLERAR